MKNGPSAITAQTFPDGVDTDPRYCSRTV